MKLKLFLCIFTLLFSSVSLAKIEVKDISFDMTKHKGLLTIHYDGSLNAYPELKVVGKSIQVIIPESNTSKIIEKSYSFSSKLKDTQVRVYQTSKNKSKLKTTLPFMIQRRKDQVALTIKENKIELSFPRVKVALKKAPVFGKIAKTKKKSVKKEFLNEAYLNKLLKVEPKQKQVKVKGIDLVKKEKLSPVDKVTMAQSSPVRADVKANSSNSFIGYIGKFVAFLGLVLLLFYGVVSLMKKGFIKKGKLGFLNNADHISVIGQNYIAPKKSLMLIKAHNQVFLVSNTENGIHPISEIKDAAGLIKNGERSISGTNFDTNLDLATLDPNITEKVQLKDDITQSNKESSISSYLNVKEKVKFSDQIKKKVKNLKPLQ